MLPAPKTGGVSLADVMESCLAALSGEPNRLALAASSGPITSALVVLVDGLGADALAARSGHARTLTAAMGSRSVIESGFPTTTAAAIGSLTTGLTPGQHGLVGYTVLDHEHGRIVNELSGYDAKLDPLTWQDQPTIFERASARGIPTFAVGPARYRDSGFSRAVLRGGQYISAASISDRMLRAVESLRSAGGGLAYVYVPELDQAGHAHGWQSGEWTRALETTDAAIAEAQRSLRGSEGMLVTGDHGMLDVPAHAHVLFDETSELVDGVRFVAGEPRCLQLHFEEDLSPVGRERLIDAWRNSESDRSWVATREEAIAANWFGAVRPEIEPRIGDLLVAARKTVAYYDTRAGSSGRSMIGQHGSWSPAEVRVPLLRYGAFARH
jgi:hypothetical protein